MKVPKADFDRLTSDSITKKEYDKLVESIHSRVNEIVEFMCKGHRLEWYDFSNEGGKDGNPGWFDPVWYKTEIELAGSFTFPPPYDSPPCFPTRWIYEDFEDEFKKTVEGNAEAVKKQKAEERNKREAKKAKRDEMISIIKSKLSKEELKFITFK